MYRIAICDDDEKDRKVFEKLIKDTQMLEESYTNIFYFASGEEILTCKNFQFDLVIMDIQMGQINGYEAAMKLRERDSYFLLVFCSGIISPTPDFFRANVFRYFDKNESEAVLWKDMKVVINEMIKSKGRVSIICKDSSKEEVRVFADIKTESGRNSEVLLGVAFELKYENGTIYRLFYEEDEQETPLGYLIVDIEGKTYYLNDPECDVMSLSYDEILQRSRLVAAEYDVADPNEGQTGLHESITIGDDTCEYQSYDDETGYYLNIVWAEYYGMIRYESGYANGEDRVLFEKVMP